MLSVLITLFLGLLIFVFGPMALRERIDSAIPGHILRVVGVIVIALGVASTSFTYIADGTVGHLFRVYGGSSLAEGRILARDGEKGPQAEVLSPGFQTGFLLNVIYNVTSQDEVVIPEGKVGALVAKDGLPLRPGQAFADPLPNLSMLDARAFLNNGGQKGPQLSVLTPGRYRINKYLWDVAIANATDIPAGFVGVVKSNVHATIDFGPLLKADKPSTCGSGAVPRRATTANTIVAPLVPTGCIGVWQAALQPGKYYFNPAAFAITPIETRAQVWTYSGGFETADIILTVDAKGDVTQSRKQRTVLFDPKIHADRAVIVRMEGWDVPLELRVVAQVAPDDASCVVAGIGGLQEAEDRVITPSIRAIARDVAGGTYQITEARVDENGKPILGANGQPIIEEVRRPTKVLDLINQRPIIEGEIEGRIRPEAANSCVTIREVRLGEPAIPPELLVAVRREQLASQLSKAFSQEKLAQEQRVTSEKAKATADQQATLVTAEIGVQASVQNAAAAKNIGQGERDKLTLIAEGQKNQMNVLGAENTVNLRKFELLADKGFSLIERHPEILTAAFSNAQKFVPNVSVGSGDLGGIFGAIAGQFMQQQDSAKPPASATGSR